MSVKPKSGLRYVCPVIKKSTINELYWIFNDRAYIPY